MAKIKGIVHWLPAVLGIATIAAESTAAMSAENTSRWLLPVWTYLFGAPSAAHWAVIHMAIRKTGHFTGYGLICLGFYNGWRFTFYPRRGRAVLSAVLCTLVLACWDEWHQSFLPGRTSSMRDVLIDLSGAIVAQCLLAVIIASRQRRLNGNELAVRS